MILVYRNDDSGGVRRLLRSAFDASRIKRAWYAPILLIVPVVTLVSYWLMRIAGEPLPEPHISLSAVLVYFALYNVIVDQHIECGQEGVQFFAITH